MKVEQNFKTFVNTLKLWKTPWVVAQPTLYLFLFVFSYFLLLWFVFAPLINNSLVTILETGKVIQTQGLSPGLDTTFYSSLWGLSHIMFWFVLAVLVLWIVFGSLLWKWLAKHLGKKPKEIVFPFALVSAIYGLYAMILIVPTARFTFYFPSNGQLIILTTVGILLLLGLHFLAIAYAQTFRKYGSFVELCTTSFAKGITQLPSFLFSYLLIAVYVVIVEVLLRLAGKVHFILLWGCLLYFRLWQFY